MTMLDYLRSGLPPVLPGGWQCIVCAIGVEPGDGGAPRNAYLRAHAACVRGAR